MSDPVPDVVQRFAGEHFTLNSISEARQVQVVDALGRLARALGKPLEEATDDDLRAWLVTLMECDLKASTVGWYLRAVTPFYHWAWQKRLIDAECYMRIRDVKPPRGHKTGAPRPYSRKQLRQMWADLDEKFPYLSDDRLVRERVISRWRNGNAHFHGRLRRHAMRLQLDAMIELALVCGLRRSEILRLSIDDVHWDNAYIVVHGKREDQNPKVREVPYPDTTREAVRAWFRFRGLMGPEPGIGLWLSITGSNPVEELTLRRMSTILQGFGPWHFHRLRHTCATERLRAGMEIEKLQRFLGHSDIGMTLRYAELLRGDVHKASARVETDFQRAIRAA